VDPWRRTRSVRIPEPLEPFLHVILVSAPLQLYMSRMDRGEVLIGSAIEPYGS
jgi:hypothetical protein